LGERERKETPPFAGIESVNFHVKGGRRGGSLSDVGGEKKDSSNAAGTIFFLKGVDSSSNP